MSRTTLNILLVPGSGVDAMALRDHLAAGPWCVRLTVETGLSAARCCLRKQSFELLLAAADLEDGSGLELLPSATAVGCPVVLLVEPGDVATAVAALKAGAADSVENRAADLERLPQLIDTALVAGERTAASRAAAQALQTSEETFRSFFESAASGMAIISPDGRPLQVNPTFRRLSGYSEDEMLSMTVLDVTHPADRDETRRLYAALRSGERRVIDYEKGYLCKDGSVVWGRATVASVFGKDGELCCLAANVQDITERKQAEAALRLSEERFRTVFNNAASGVVTIGPDGRFMEVNEAFCRFIGYAADELLELSVVDITDAKDRGQTEDNYRQLGSGQVREVKYQKRFRRRDGSMIWGQVAVASVPDAAGVPLYYIGLVQDITETRQIQAELRESKQMLQLVLDYIPQHVFWKDRDSVYLGSNRNFARAAGVGTPQELVGKTDYQLAWKKEEADFYRSWDQKVMAADAPELHIIEPQLQASGKQAWLDCNKIPLHNAAGEVVGILGTFEDITERKQAEEELIAANRELDAFVYTVSHDLRTLLTPIIGYAEVLRDLNRERLDRQSLDGLDSIENLGRRMLALMEDLLALAKVGHLERPLEPVDLDRLVAESTIGFGSQLAETGITVERHPLPKVRIPKTLLRQLFDNLIGNAVRYAGRVDSPIRVGGKRYGDRVELYVRDHGPGIAAGDRSRIFDVFYRGATENKVPGTGVGLATVQKIARLYGGRAWVEETPGGGSTFRVALLDSEEACPT